MLARPRPVLRRPRTFVTAAALFLVPLVGAGTSRPTQSAPASPTCGWSFIDPHDVPPTLQLLRSRIQEAPDWLPDAEAQLLRWYRECDETAGRTAARSLQTTRNRTNSSDPLLLAWLGVALVRGPEVQVPQAEGVFLRATHRSSNAERDGARLLARVAESNDWPEVAEELAAVAVATRKDETLDLASRTLWKVAEARDEPALWSALTEVELVRGDHDAADRAATRGVSAGAPRALRAAGILSMQAGNDARGAELYLRGLDRAVEESDVQPFFDDLRLLLGEDELAQWQALGNGRAEWIRRKWEWRAQMAGVRLDERLGVNERRFVEVMNRYRRTSFRGAPGEFPMWDRETGAWRLPLDDRGITFLRHGEPATELGRRGPRIAWIYGGPTSKPMVFEFSNSYGSVVRADYYLAEPSPCPVSAPRRGPPPPPSDYASTLASFDPQLGWYYIRCEQFPDWGSFGYADARTTARRDAAAGWSSESGIVRFRKPLETAWNLYAFQTPAGPELVNFLSVYIGNIVQTGGAGTRIDLDLLISVGNPLTETSAQLDTTLSLATSFQLDSNTALQWALPVRTPANENARVTLSVRNKADETQGRIASTTWSVPAFDKALLLSDIVVAEPRDGVLHRGTHDIAPAPGHAIFENTPFRLYYELYGAEAGDPLAVAIRVLPAKGESMLAKLRDLISSRNALSVEFDEQARPDADGVMRVEREYQAELDPGAYSVVVTIRDARTDETVTMDTNLVVAKR